MENSNIVGIVGKPRRLTMAEVSGLFHSVATKRRPQTSAGTFVETKALQKINEPKNLSKTAALGIPEKILALVALYPAWGTKKLADSLADQGVSLSRQSIHKILRKYNLSRPDMRKTWQSAQKETDA